MARFDRRFSRWLLASSVIFVALPASAQNVEGTLTRLAVPLWTVMVLLAIAWPVGVFFWSLRRIEHLPWRHYPTQVRKQALRSIGWSVLLALGVYSAIVLVAGDTGFEAGVWLNRTVVWLLIVFVVVQVVVLLALIWRLPWSGRYAFASKRRATDD